MKKTFAITLLLLSLCLSLQVRAQKDWTFHKEKDGVKIYKRTTDDGHEVKLVTIFDCSTSALVQLLNNVAEYPKWGYKVAYSKLLKRVSDTEFYYYSRYDFPWPLDDRDVIMHTRITKDASTGIVTLHSVADPGYIPEKKGIVRVKKAVVSWTLQPQGDQKTKGEYCLSTDPGGMLPGWTVKLANDSGPVTTVNNMKKLLAEERYQNLKLATAQ
ncbi:MAG: hypothetical protein H6565_00775 [Lewinellaceae bacterium]|nr:hypothetical protein [Lewinellaceae bacterium]